MRVKPITEIIANRQRSYKAMAERRMRMFDMLGPKARDLMNYATRQPNLSTIRKALQGEGKWPK